MGSVGVWEERRGEGREGSGGEKEMCPGLGKPLVLRHFGDLRYFGIQGFGGLRGCKILGFWEILGIAVFLRF